jgi:hypothetical protein
LNFVLPCPAKVVHVRVLRDCWHSVEFGAQHESSTIPAVPIPTERARFILEADAKAKGFRRVKGKSCGQQDVDNSRKRLFSELTATLSHSCGNAAEHSSPINSSELTEFTILFL